MGKYKKLGPVVIEREVINSKAFLSLTGIAPQLYLLFLARRKMAQEGKRGHKRWNCINSQEIEFTYIEAKKKFGISERRFRKGIDCLGRDQADQDHCQTMVFLEIIP